MRKFGCVWFDDYGTGGCASISGDKSFRIEGTHDLPSDVLWVTSLDWNGMKNAGIHQHPRFRMNNFMRIKLSSLAIELDINNEGDTSIRVSILAEIIDRVCRLSQSIFGITDFGKDLATSLRQSILSERDAQSYGSPLIDYALKNAIQSWQKCEVVPPKDGKFYSWRFPRLDYMEYMLGFPVPNSKWHKVNLDSIGDPRAYINANLNEKPIMCKVIINKINNVTFAKIMPFGYGKQNARIWSSGQEILHYMNYADVSIELMIESDSYRQLYLRLPNFDEMTGRISISMGIVAENCWKSLSAKITPRAVWYSAWDRISCSKTAIELSEAGISVMSYGNGMITMSVHEDQYQFVFDKCISLGLTPPLNMISHMEIVS